MGCDKEVTKGAGRKGMTDAMTDTYTLYNVQRSLGEHWTGNPQCYLFKGSPFITHNYTVW